MKKQYVIGLLFNDRRTLVALIRKARPDWQRGLLNGVGGKVEANEAPLAAMVREFGEETGMLIAAERWERFLELHYPDCVLHVFRTFGDPRQVRSVTDELVGVFPVDWWHGMVPNLRWIIPLAAQERIVGGVLHVSLYHDGAGTVAA